MDGGQTRPKGIGTTQRPARQWWQDIRTAAVQAVVMGKPRDRRRDWGVGCKIFGLTFRRSNQQHRDGWEGTGPKSLLVNARLQGQKLDGSLPVGWDRPNRQCLLVAPRVRGHEHCSRNGVDYYLRSFSDKILLKIGEDQMLGPKTAHKHLSNSSGGPRRRRRRLMTTMAVEGVETRLTA